MSCKIRGKIYELIYLECIDSKSEPVSTLQDTERTLNPFGVVVGDVIYKFILIC